MALPRVVLCAVLCAVLALPAALCDLSPVEKWLSAQVLALPDAHFDLGGAVGVEGDLTNITCSGLVLGSSSSSLNSPTELTVAVSVAHVACHCNWAYKEKLRPHLPRGSGDVNITIGDSSIGPVKLKVVIDRATGLPTNVTVGECDTSVDVADYHFSRGATGTFLNLIKPFILSMLDAQFDRKVCDALPKQAAAMDALLAKADAFAKPLLQPVPPATPPSIPDDVATQLVDFETSALVSSIDAVFRTLGANHSAVLDTVAWYLTNRTGVLRHTFHGVNTTFLLAPMGTNATLSLVELTVGGLDSFVNFDVLSPQSNFSLSTALSLANANVSVVVELAIGAGAYGPASTARATLNMRLGETILNTTALVGIWSNALHNSTLGQLALQPPCVLDSLFAVNITHLLVSPALEAAWLSGVSGDLATKAAGLVNGVAQLVSRGFGVVAMEVVRGFVGGEGREAVNSAVSELIGSHPTCEPYSPPPSRDHDMVDFETSKAVSLLNAVVNQDLGAAGVNGLVSYATLALYGEEGAVFIDTPRSLDVVGGVVNVTSLNATNLNTLQRLDVLVPVSPDVLNNSVVMGGDALPTAHVMGTQRSVNMSVAMSVDFSTSKDVPPMSGAFKLGMGMTELIASAQLLAQLNQTKLFEMTVDNLTSADCMLATVHKAELRGMDVSLHNLSVAMSDGTSAIFRALTEAVNSLNSRLPPSLQLPVGTATLVNEQVQALLKDADARCRGENPGGSGKSFPTTVVAASVSAGVAVVALTGFVFRRKLGRLSEVRSSLWGLDKDGRDSLLEMEGMPPPSEISLLAAAKRRYPGTTYQLLKFAFPAFLLATLVLKIVALCSLVSRIKLTIYDRDHADAELTHLYLIDFTFGNMVRYFWNSKAYIITLLIVGGVCVLPICKCLVLCALWFKPAKERTRRIWLGLVDQAGRLAFIDAFFLAEIVILFQIDIVQEGLLVKMRADPDFAVLGGIASSIGFSLCSHLMLALHFKCCKVPAPTAPQGTGASVFVPLLTVLVAGVCNGMAVWYKLAVFTTGGAAGLAQGKAHATTTFDYYTLQLDMPGAVDREHFVDAWYVSVMMIVLTMVAPAMVAVLTVLSVLVPKSHKPTVLALLWFVSSWCGLDVLLWSFIAGTLEMEKIAQWIFNNKYGPICGALPTLAHTQCVTIHTTFEEGFWWLLGATVVMFVVVRNVATAWEHRNDDDLPQFQRRERVGNAARRGTDGRA